MLELHHQITLGSGQGEMDQLGLFYVSIKERAHRNIWKGETHESKKGEKNYFPKILSI